MEKRSTRRVAVAVACEIHRGTYAVSAATEDLSEGGVRVGLARGAQLGVLPKTGDKVGAALFLTQDGIEDADAEQLAVECEVRWVKETPTGLQLGLQFAALSADEREQLLNFLAAQTS